MATQHPSRLDGDLSTLLGLYAEELADVLHDGSVDHRSERVLAAVHRGLNSLAAAFTKQPPPPVSDLRELSDRDFYETWADHVGALWVVANHHMPRHVLNALDDARLAWADEIDAMTDAELLAVKGIGRKGLEGLRQALDLYYWRSDRQESRAVWERMVDRYGGTLEYCRKFDYRDRAARCEASLEFVQQVLAEDGAPLADRAAPRMAAV